jgi:hypothetical protein
MSDFFLDSLSLSLSLSLYYELQLISHWRFAMERVATILAAVVLVTVVVASEWNTGPRVMTDDEARAIVGGAPVPCGPCLRLYGAGHPLRLCANAPGVTTCDVVNPLCNPAGSKTCYRSEERAECARIDCVPDYFYLCSSP